ncbi:DNA repair protein RecN [Methylocapsa sp. S129]|uniref:DNA repair protein RecN n=1 Tax=Methylocapsa sp. S129 TaxID=1641869 RepID=UPI00131A9D41|nr:DNA repair protein RecN [Methylocapsa sp. S129]
MLVRLAIRDIVLIDQLDLEFAAGLSILTGETGAGKSILLDALSLALGARGDGALVRQGQAQGQVTAVFDLADDHPALAMARERNIETDGELILRRVQLADGRTRAFINDQPVSAQMIRVISGGLVEIHGQHDERALMDASTHRTLVDAYGALDAMAESTKAAFGAVKAVESELADETARVAAAQAEADFAAHAHQELTKLAVEPGEEEVLAERRSQMMQAEKVSADIREAYESLSGEASATPILVAAARRLERRLSQAPTLIEPCVKALDSALEALDAATSAIETALRAADFDPNELERAEARLFALRGMSRKYSAPVAQLAALAEKYGADLAALDAGRARLVALTQAAKEARRQYALAAASLSKARQSSARELERAVGAELAPLKLERARFIVEIASDPNILSAEGIDRVEFCVQTNPGSRAGPLMRVASGGELARFMLALKVALADRGSAPTLVFDEIDTGVGGAVADAIGQRLARLATRAQVLAVTHAPQVAARSTSHFRIAKSDVGRGERVATRVLNLDAPARREEIARMLAGATITEEARAAAKRLIENAG